MQSPNTDGLLDMLIEHFERVTVINTATDWPDSRGEYWAPCPFHGERARDSFSFSTRGFKCFGCPESGGLLKLASHVGLLTGGFAPQERTVVRKKRARREARKPTPDWVRDPALWRRFQPMPDEVRAYCHGRGITDTTIARWRLGHGVLPWSRCQHPRLIVPLFKNGVLVGLRGRALTCGCPPDCPGKPPDCGHCKKWLQSAQSEKMLFGAETIGHRRDILLVEAPLSVTLATQEWPDIGAVAPSTGVGVWLPEWTDTLAIAEPTNVAIWYDNDPGGQMFAVKRAEELSRAGVRNTLVRWRPSAPAKADIGDVLLAGRMNWVSGL
jgi:hypothetical protein